MPEQAEGGIGIVFLVAIIIMFVILFSGGNDHHQHHVRPAPNGAYFKNGQAYTADGFRLSENAP